MARGSQLYAKWALEMRRSELFRAGERVGAAVSGGADSVLLFDFLKRFSLEKGLTPVVVHFNHRLRGAESDGDEKFVRELARENEVEFMGSSADVGQEARSAHANLEATARQFRYKFFFGLVRQGKLDKVATAHTADDQAETVLLRLLRGAGSRGLAGIYPSLDGMVVRPFLNLTRAEVRAEVASRELRYRTDSSNLDTRLARNKVRAKLLPWLAREFNPRIVHLLRELTTRAREDEAYLEQQARERARPWRVKMGQEEKITLSTLADFHPAVERRVLRQMIAAARGSLRGITHDHVEALRRFVSGAQSGRQLDLPGAVARREFDWLVIAPEVPAGPARRASSYCYPVEVPGVVSVPQLRVEFQFKILGTDELGKSYNNSGVGSLDRAKLRAPLVLRNWRAGDRFQPRGARRALKLKELFARSKIPSAERHLWPVLDSEAGIVWVRGFPPANAAAADTTTEQVVTIGEQQY